jgi:hypothetical protein
MPICHLTGLPALRSVALLEQIFQSTVKPCISTVRLSPCRKANYPKQMPNGELGSLQKMQSLWLLKSLAKQLQSALSRVDMKLIGSLVNTIAFVAMPSFLMHRLNLMLAAAGLLFSNRQIPMPLHKR